METSLGAAFAHLHIITIPRGRKDTSRLGSSKVGETRNIRWVTWSEMNGSDSTLLLFAVNRWAGTIYWQTVPGGGARSCCGHIYSYMRVERYHVENLRQNMRKTTPQEELL